MSGREETREVSHESRSLIALKTLASEEERNSISLFRFWIGDYTPCCDGENRQAKLNYSQLSIVLAYNSHWEVVVGSS